MSIHIRDGDIHLLDIRTRMPFKYGIATMTSTPHAFVRLRVEVEGKLAIGISADHLPPKWFTKDPARPIADEVAEMLRVIGHAVEVAHGVRGASAFDVWRQVWDAQAEWGRRQGLPPLLVHFGTSLIERAMIEAVCRAAGEPFAHLLRANRFGIRLGDIHPPLEGRSPAELLPERPSTDILIRHTVGLADPLVDADIAPEERLDDGLPQSLAACIQTYGLRQFKIKVSGDVGRDRDRLRRIAEVIEAHAPADYRFSFDGNEQFHSFDAFRVYWDDLSGTEGLRDFFRHLRFIEQPLHRDLALEPAVGEMMQARPVPARIIIDESDGDLDSLPRALSLGYAGTSHKNCKGVFKGIANRCLLALRERADRSRPYLMTGEDLANIGPVALLQDLAVCATLGLQGVERNGHHYFAGLSMFPADVQQQVLAIHGDLYHPSRDGWPTLAIRDGSVRVGSV
ncbi:MAG TPA: hypothetical protein VNK04_04280, partial [Gemmataceae bacterium]|nr:hypothetical protein [Gemmataceae bacterium]